MEDLLDDQELASLRMAALATLHRANKSEDVSVNKISTIQTVTSIPNQSSSHVGGNNGNDTGFQNKFLPRRNQNMKWAKQQPQKLPRSNLIVITPVGGENNDCEDSSKPENFTRFKEGFRKQSTASTLALPQMKFLQATNEDSSSPKSYRKTGPTRFNRHDSESDSDDSDCESSDSSETILQDEPAEQLLSEENTETEPLLENDRTGDQRLNFYNLDTELEEVESTSVYNRLQQPITDFSSALPSIPLPGETPNTQLIGLANATTNSYSQVPERPKPPPTRKVRVPITAPVSDPMPKKSPIKLITFDKEPDTKKTSAADNAKSRKAPTEYSRHDLRLELKRRQDSQANSRTRKSTREKRHRNRSSSSERGRSKRRRSWSKSPSRSSSGSSRSASRTPVKGISSVIQSVKLAGSNGRRLNASYSSAAADTLPSGRDMDRKGNVTMLLSKNNEAADNKRVPVHMRLGNFQRNKVVKIAKDVEAAFHCSSSDEEKPTRTSSKKTSPLVVMPTVDEPLPKGKAPQGRSAKRQIVWNTGRRGKSNR